MANYSENLINALMRRDVSVKVVTSHCVCKGRYRGSSSLFGGKYSLVTTPFDSYGDEPDRSRIRGLVYRASRIPLGLRYVKECRENSRGIPWWSPGQSHGTGEDKSYFLRGP